MKRQILYVGFLICILSCNSDRQESHVVARVDSTVKQIKKDSPCNIYGLDVPETVSHDKNIILINKPVAIGFWNLNTFLAKHEGRVDQGLDSVPEKLKHPSRQEIYRAYDIAGMYGAFVKPTLDSMSIKIIDTVKTVGYIAFNVNGKRYVIDKALYQESDGVLFYNGKDKPIFWTEGFGLDPECIIKSYYSNE
ncbi:hypothetical protein [Cytophaga aurantiaca]|uniref:hypothetical protein n=1 Tax=Cytophaga aurantiaca TaxID=29530 RepID=UPI000362F802|nr:hypothetical protein [Cytophaga aurantiaca]